MLQIILIQVKGGSAAMPTREDATRLRQVAKRLHARCVLLAAWKKGSQARFFRPKERTRQVRTEWAEVSDLDAIFRCAYFDFRECWPVMTYTTLPATIIRVTASTAM
jgi:hypothetical protein